MPNDQRLGTILRDGARVGLRYERDLGHAPERVGRMLTENDGLRHWFPCELVGERTPGVELTARFWPDIASGHDGDTPDLSARVLVWEPPTRFSWVWDTEELHYELTGTPTGTHLVLTVWLGEGPGIASTAAGYHTCLDHLGLALDTGTAPSLLDAAHEALQAAYAELASSAGLDPHAPTSR